MGTFEILGWAPHRWGGTQAWCTAQAWCAEHRHGALHRQLLKSDALSSNKQVRSAVDGKAPSGLMGWCVLPLFWQVYPVGSVGI